MTESRTLQTAPFSGQAASAAHTCRTVTRLQTADLIVGLLQGCAYTELLPCEA